MRVLILIEGREDGRVEVVTATAEGAAKASAHREAAAAYVIHEVERALLLRGFTRTDEPGGDDDEQHGSD